ncbi:MAG: dihydroneopterin aldolase [Bacteroidetes bacterium]|jgi:dihydroneopterin aldolase|nr:dihydroneopterin aldolase [Bacteroidota bacterium]
MAPSLPPDVIRLRNAVFYAYHGVLTDEQNLGGKFEVDVDLFGDLSRGATTDHLRDTVDYTLVYEAIRASVMGKKYFLLEALGEAIARAILKDFRKISVVTVRVRKPGAPIKGVVDTVEVEVTRSRGSRK